MLLDRSVISRLLRFRLFHALSVLSYGMYLNHFILVAILVPIWPRVTAGLPPVWSLSLGVATLFSLSALIAVCTYILIEHPFLVLRDRWLGHRKV